MQRHFNHHRELQIPFASAAHVLYDEPAVLLGVARDQAMKLADQHEFTPHVMAPMPTPSVEHDVEIELGETHRLDHRTVSLPIRWVVVDGAHWFPSVDATIEVTDLGDEDHPWCDLSFFGAYTPRHGLFGAALDVAGAHAATQDTLANFFETVCDLLARTVAMESQST